MKRHSTVLVIGCSVIGGCIAVELNKRGIDVTVIERGSFFNEASKASAGGRPAGCHTSNRLTG